MSSDCGSWFSKYVLCFVNFLTLTIGAVVFGSGLWLVLDKSSYIALYKLVEVEDLKQFTEPEVFEHLGYIFIACGLLMIFIGFCGTCGALRESQCLLALYITAIALVIIVEIVGVVFFFVYKDQTRDETKLLLKSTIDKYYNNTDKRDAVTVAWNRIMEMNSCCGVDNSTDFLTSQSWNMTRGAQLIPESCCILEDFEKAVPRDSSCVTNPTELNSYADNGCLREIYNWTSINQNYIICFGIGILLLQLFALFLTCCLFRSIKKYRGLRL